MHATDVSNASRTMLFDIRAMAWSTELCDLFGVPAEMLGEVRPSSGRFGVTAEGTVGVGGGIPISGIGGDQQAALFGQACFEPGMTKNTYGTGSFVLMNVGEQCPDPVDGLLTTVAWTLPGEALGGAPGSPAVTHYALEGAIFVTGAAVQWLRDGLGIIADAAEIEPLAASIPDSEGVVLVPAFTGLGSPWWDPYARGTLLGITRGTGRAHLARAVVEAMAFQTRDVVEAMSAASGRQVLELRADGGASAMHLLLQLQADQLQVPVSRPDRPRDHRARRGLPGRPGRGVLGLDRGHLGQLGARHPGRAGGRPGRRRRGLRPLAPSGRAVRGLGRGSRQSSSAAGRVEAAGLDVGQLAKSGVDDPGQRCRLAPLPSMERGALAAEHERHARPGQRGPDHVVGTAVAAGHLGRRLAAGTKATSHGTAGASPSWATISVPSSSTTTDHAAPIVRTEWMHSSSRALDRVEAPTRMAAVSSASSRGSRSESAAGVMDSTSTPSTCCISAMSRSTRSIAGKLDDELVDGPAGATLEDVDAHHVAADRAHPAGHLAQRAGTIRQPHSQDVGQGHATTLRIADERHVSGTRSSDDRVVTHPTSRLPEPPSGGILTARSRDS